VVADHEECVASTFALREIHCTVNLLIGGCTNISRCASYVSGVLTTSAIYLAVGYLTIKIS